MLKEYISLLGLSLRQFSALQGAGYSLGQTAHCDGLFCRRNSFSQSRPQPSRQLSNVFFTDLLNHQWQPVSTPTREMFKVGQILVNGFYNVLPVLC